MLQVTRQLMELFLNGSQNIMLACLLIKLLIIQLMELILKSGQNLIELILYGGKHKMLVQAIKLLTIQSTALFHYGDQNRMLV